MRPIVPDRFPGGKPSTGISTPSSIFGIYSVSCDGYSPRRRTRKSAEREPRKRADYFGHFPGRRLFRPNLQHSPNYLRGHNLQLDERVDSTATSSELSPSATIHPRAVQRVAEQWLTSPGHHLYGLRDNQPRND